MRDFVIIVFILLTYDIIISIISMMLKKKIFNVGSNDKICSNNSRQLLKPTEVAEKILEFNNIKEIKIKENNGDSRYVPKLKTIYLDTNIININVTSYAMAVHECGHVIQHKENKFMYYIVATSSIVRKIAKIFTFISLLFLILNILNKQTVITIFLISSILHILNSILLLLLEKDASVIGIRESKRLGLLTNAECEKAGEILKAAFSTYVYNVLCAFTETGIFIILMGVL